MRLPLAIFIYFVTVYQPAIAVTADEDVKPAPSDNGHEQSGAAAPSSKVTRGQMLYENHCTSCHESTVYIRTKRKATNYKEVGNWVKQRADWLNLGWGIVEKQEVLQYLNERYYKYPLAE
jgi:cytochrome c5